MAAVLVGCEIEGVTGAEEDADIIAGLTVGRGAELSVFGGITGEVV